MKAREIGMTKRRSE